MMARKVLRASGLVCGVVLACASGAAAGAVSNFDDLAEGFLGTTLAYNGVTYSNVNNVGGVFPGGDTFVPDDVGDQLIIENATLLYNDFPAWGSGPNALTFGTAFIPGNNLSLGAFVKADLAFDAPVSSLSFDMVYYENGPWGGIVFHLDGIRNGAVVASQTITIADGGGRDNLKFDAMSIAGEFDSAKIYATFGSDYSAPRLMIDNLTVTPVPAPGAAVLLAGGVVAMRRRRR